MNVLIACEFSGVVREAFRSRGHNAWSCDIIQSADGSKYHLMMDAILAARSGVPNINRPLRYWSRWDLVIAHPPCTYLSLAGVRWIYKNGKRSESGGDLDIHRLRKMVLGAQFFRDLWDACPPTTKLAFENPRMCGYAVDLIGLGRRTQEVQPWWFGDKKLKATCWWLRDLPELQQTNCVGPGPKEGEPGYSEWAECHYASASGETSRGHRRSIFYKGMADAIAEQWGS